MPINPSFSIGADQTLYPSRGINQGIGCGSYSWDDTPKFPLNVTISGSQIGNPGPALQGRVAAATPAATYNKAFRYLQCLTKAPGLPNNGQAVDAVGAGTGFYNRSGVTIPYLKYFWAIGG